MAVGDDGVDDNFVPSNVPLHVVDMLARSIVRPALSAVKAQPQQQAGMATLREIENR